MEGPDPPPTLASFVFLGFCILLIMIPKDYVNSWSAAIVFIVVSVSLATYSLYQSLREKTKRE